MGSVPKIIKDMVPSGIKNELREIQGKSYSKISASDVFSIGKNLLITLPTGVDKFCIKNRENEYEIPFLAKDRRFNIQVDKITEYNIRSGVYQIKAKKGNSYFGIETSEKNVLLTDSSHGVSFSIILKNSQLYLEILNSKDSNLYLLNKKARILPLVDARLDFANDNFVGITLTNNLKLENIFLENGFGKRIDVKFWKNNQKIIFDWQSIVESDFITNDNVFFFMGIVQDEKNSFQIVFSLEKENHTIATSEKKELDHVFVDKIRTFSKYLAYSHSTNEVSPWRLSEKLIVNNNKIIFTLDNEQVQQISSACCVVKKNGYVEDIPVIIEKNTLIIDGELLLGLPIGYVIDLYIYDKNGYQHRLIDRKQKKLADIYRHYLVKATDGTKTYVYYTKTGRVSFFRTVSPIELVKAKESDVHFEMRYSDGKLYFNSQKKYEAILQISNVEIKNLPVTFTNGVNLIDFTNIKFTIRHLYKILLKEVGNHNYNYVNVDVLNEEKSTNLTFIGNSLSFMKASPLKLSVIVTFYNTQKYLDRLFTSLLNQGLAPTEYEILAVNDCSTDRSRQIAEKFAKKYPQFKIIDHEINKGLGEARNTGIKNAKAEYITFVDGDDFINDNAYSNMLDIITKTKSQIITGGVKRYRNNKPEISWVYRKVFVKNIERTTIEKNPELVYDTTAWNKIYNREWFIHEGFQYPTMLYEDIPVTIPAFNKAPSIDIYSGDMYFWFIRNQKGDESITNNRTDILNFTDRMRAIKVATRSLRNNPRALFEYEQKVLTMDIPMYLRHFHHVTNEYRHALSEETQWILDNFMKSAFEVLSVRDIQRIELTANADFEHLFKLYEEGELAE